MNHNRNSKVTNGLPQIGIEEDRRITAQHRISGEEMLVSIMQHRIGFVLVGNCKLTNSHILYIDT